MKAEDKDGNKYVAGSFKAVNHMATDHTHAVYVTKNDTLIGWIDVEDEVRPEAKQVWLTC